MVTTYIYCLEFDNGRKYVGKTTNLKQRWASHKCARTNKSTRQHVNDNTKYILEDICTENDSKEYEQKWINYHGGLNNLTNRQNPIKQEVVDTCYFCEHKIYEHNVDSHYHSWVHQQVVKLQNDIIKFMYDNFYDSEKYKEAFTQSDYFVDKETGIVWVECLTFCYIFQDYFYSLNNSLIFDKICDKKIGLKRKEHRQNVNCYCVDYFEMDVYAMEF
jgi:predicted GIY-YIG superfamily endonuclease